jgi:hypothetical protein
VGAGFVGEILWEVIGMRLAIVCLLIACGCDESMSPTVAPRPMSSPPPAGISVLQTPVNVDHGPELLKFLNELDGFKMSESFALYGFGQGGPHLQWLNRLRDAKSRVSPGVGRLGFGMLEELGMAYVASRGQETDKTKHFRSELEAVTLAPML